MESMDRMVEKYGAWNEKDFKCYKVIPINILLNLIKVYGIR